MVDPSSPYVSRGGWKLAAALEAFALSPRGWTCADLGCSVGGFTDCLLQHGAERVYAVDTAYGDLAWKLRQDERVVVLERTNALHFDPWNELVGFPGCDLATIDLGWTRQERAVPAAQQWLSSSGPGLVLTLVKPHYEQPRPTGNRRGRKRPKPPPLDQETAEAVLEQTLHDLSEAGFNVIDRLISPIIGSKGGNPEFLALLNARRHR